MAREIAVSFALNANLTGGYKAAFQGAASQARSVTQAIREMEKSPVGKLGASMATQREKIKGLSGSLKEAQSGLSVLQSRAAAAGGASGMLARQIEQAEKRVAGLSGALNRQVSSWKSTAAQAATVGGSVRGLAHDYSALAAKIDHARKVQTAFAANRSQAEALRSQRADLHSRLLGTAVTGATVALPVKLAISAEDTYADLRKVMDAPEEVMQQVFADAQQMSNRTGKSFEDVVTIMTAAAQAGLGKTREELLGVADQAVKMSIAWNVSAEQAGKSMATWQAAMGLTSEQARHTGDVINALSNAMNAEAGEIDRIFTRMGPLMKGTGFATQDIAALATAFKAAGAEVEVSGTAMKNFVKVMAAGSAGLTDEKAGIYKYLQIDPNALQKQLVTDAKGAVLRVLEALERVRPEERNSIMSRLFGEESVAAITPLMTQIDTLRQAFKIANSDVSGSVQQEYENRMKTTATAISQLTQTTRNLGVTVGNTLLPVVGAVARGLAGAVNFVSDLAGRFPRLTAVVMTGAAALATLAVGGLGVALIMNVVKTSTNAWQRVLLKLVASQVTATASTGGLGIAGLAFGAASRVAGAGARFFAGGLRSILVASGVGVLLVALGYGLMALIDNWDAVVSAMSAAWVWVKDTWGRLGVFFTTLGANLAAIFPGIASAITDAFTWAHDTVVSVWQGVTGFFSGVWQGVCDMASTAWQTVTGWASWAVEGVSAVWSGITIFFSGVVDGIIGIFAGLFDWLKENFSWIFKAIDAVGATIGKITGAVGNAWDKAFGDDAKTSSVPTAQAAQEKPAAAVAQAIQSRTAAAITAGALQSASAPSDGARPSYADFVEAEKAAKKKGKKASGSGGRGKSGPVTVVTLAGDNSAPQTLFIPAARGASGGASLSTAAAASATASPRVLPQTPAMLAARASRRTGARESGPTGISVDLKQDFNLIAGDARAVRKVLESIKPDMEALVRRALEKLQSDRRRTSYAQ